MNQEDSGSGFSLGRIFATPGVLDALAQSGESPSQFLERHAQCDWGCVSRDDAQLNREAIQTGARILSAYETRQGVRLWIITEAADTQNHRASTTLLLPQEY